MLKKMSRASLAISEDDVVPLSPTFATSYNHLTLRVLSILLCYSLINNIPPTLLTLLVQRTTLREHGAAAHARKLHT
jgi:hypothetical protein